MSNEFDVDTFAQEIRRVDGAHSLGAGALAEALMPYLSALIAPSGTAADMRARCAKVVQTHKPDASFDDSMAGAVERAALLSNIAAEILALPLTPEAK